MQHSHSSRRLELGRWGQERAADYLRAQGVALIAANWHCPAGEVDLVGRDGEWLAFVEVRTRRGDQLGTPEESITPRKLAHMAAVAETFVYEQDWDGPWRLDVVAVRAGAEAQIEWYKNVSG